MPTLKENGQRLNGKGSSWIRAIKRLAIYLRDGFICQYCGQDLRWRDRRGISLDHLIPRCKGGSNHETNLVTACIACNSSRQDRPWREFATGGAIERIERTVLLPLNMDMARALQSGHARNSKVETR